MNKETIEILSTIGLESKPRTFTEFMKTLDLRILILFQKKAQSDHKKSIEMITEIRKQYSEYLGRMSSSNKEKAKLSMNVVRMLEILVEIRMGKLSFTDIDCTELKFLLKPKYDEDMFPIYKGFTEDLFELMLYPGFIKTCSALYELDWKKYGLKDMTSKMTANQGKISYLEHLLRHSMKTKCGQIDLLKHKIVSEIDAKNAEILRSIVPAGSHYSFVPLPTNVVTTFEEAQEFSKEIMKASMDNLIIHAEELRTGKRMGLFRGNYCPRK